MDKSYAGRYQTKARKLPAHTEQCRHNDLIAVLAGRGGERRLVELAAVEGLGAAGDYMLTPAVDRASAGERA
jgi:hypothetical protein